MPTAALQDLFHETLARYILVRPTGIQICPGRLVSSLSAQILTFRPARTLYQNRQPTCRSLDGIQALQQGRACASCLMRKACTPQIYLELLADNLPLRLILAYSSARNFMTFVSRLRTQHHPIENAHIIISVRDRGRWGELHFISQPPPQSH